MNPQLLNIRDMKQIILLLLILGTSVAISCQNAPVNPVDRRFDKNTLTVATYNVEWLFLNGSSCPGTGCPWNNETAWAHLNQTALVIRSLNADIIHLAEVQDCYVLGELNRAVPDMGYLPYLIPGFDSITGQNVGLLTRVDPIVDLQRDNEFVEFPPPGSVCGYGQVGSTGISKHYYTTFRVNGIDISMIGVHLKANPNDPYSCAQREGQAVIANRIIKEQIFNTDREGIILGDINDFDGEVLDAAGDRPKSRVLQMLKTPGLNTTSTRISGGSPNIYTYWNKNANCIGCSQCAFSYPMQAAAIDHILVTRGLYSRLLRTEDVHSYSPNCTNFFSDHWPVVSVFDMRGVPANSGLSGGAIASIVIAAVAVVVAIVLVSICYWNRRQRWPRHVNYYGAL